MYEYVASYTGYSVDFIALIGSIVFPVLGVLGGAALVYLKMAKETTRWRTMFEMKVDGLEKEISALKVESQETGKDLTTEIKTLVVEVRSLVTTQTAANGKVDELNRLYKRLHQRLDGYSDRLKRTEHDIVVFKAVHDRKPAANHGGTPE